MKLRKPADLSGFIQRFQMRTNKKPTETDELQATIRQLAKQLGWSIPALAEKLHYKLYETDEEYFPHEEEEQKAIQTFQARFAKQLKRPTTKPERLQRYLDLIRLMPEFSRLDQVVNRYVPLGGISEELRHELHQVSKKLDAAFNTDAKSVVKSEHFKP